MLKFLGKKLAEPRRKSWREYYVSNSRYFCDVFLVENSIFGSLKLVDQSWMLGYPQTLLCLPESVSFSLFSRFSLV